MSSKKQQINSFFMLAFIVTTLLGFTNAETVGSKDLFRCRQSCYQKFVQDWHHCMDFEDCKNCWNNCDQQLGPFPLNINSALRQGSLVLTTIGWDQAITNASKQCLVTWEVSGGGLMGNLLTDSSTVELSLWPDTVYHVQVTCKHKETGGMRRSYKLIVDTHKLSDSTVTGMQAITLETGNMANKVGMMPHLYGGAADIGANPGETDSRMRILKDSSKDFLSPYNPNANNAAAGSSTTTSNGRSSSITASERSSSTTSERSNNRISSAKSTTTTTKATITTQSNTNKYTETNEEEQSADYNSVLRTKLVDKRTANFNVTDFLIKELNFVVLGYAMLFLALIMLYMLLRPSARKQIPAGAKKLDKEVLIHTELLPSQTPEAAAQLAAAAHAATSKKSTALAEDGPTTSCSDAAAVTAHTQTLHV
ncbi:uncharacterized protein [Eurosta solidaginis]|uniref:uncharacterized protein isoform X2 n=1 Tax=Eurosta solidaginis TaxID=178769 RepID=UPI0035310B9F